MSWIILSFFTKEDASSRLLGNNVLKIFSRVPSLDTSQSGAILRKLLRKRNRVETSGRVLFISFRGGLLAEFTGELHRNFIWRL